MLRPLTALAISGLAAFSLAACTSNTQSCSGGKCDIDLSGKGATVVLGGDGGSEMELISASGKTAKVKIAGQEGDLTVGEPVSLNNATLTLVKVEGKDDIQVKLDTTGFSQTTPTEEEAPAEESDDSDKKKKKSTTSR